MVNLVKGNKNCETVNDGFKMDCPAYATASCYTGASVHDFYDSPVNEIYKGCSSFEIEGGFEGNNASLPGDDGTITLFSLTKTTCRGAYCNEEHSPPVNPGDPNSGPNCQVCSVTVDEYNKTVGM
jgi:hypothetical protein